MEKINIKTLGFFAREHGDLRDVKKNSQTLMRKDKKYIMIGQKVEGGSAFRDLATGEVYQISEDMVEVNGDKFKEVHRNRDYELSYQKKKNKVAYYLECKNSKLMNNDFFFLEYLAIAENKKVAGLIEKIFDSVPGKYDTTEKEIKLVDNTYNDMIHSFYKDLAKAYQKETNHRSSEDELDGNGI